MATDIRQLLPTNVRAALLAGSAPSSINPYVTASALSSFGFVPYTGATANVDLGAFSLTSPTIYGSGLASGTLTLASTSNATKGVIQIGTTDLVNIGNKTTTSQRLVRIGQDTAWMDIGSLGGGGSANGAIYFNQVTPGLPNSALWGNASATNLNVPTGGNINIKFNNSDLVTMYGTLTGVSLPNFLVTLPSMTTVTTTANSPSFRVTGANKQWATGTVANQYWNYLTANTAAFVGASTMTNSYGLFVEAATAGTNATITNNWAIGTNGDIQIGGNQIVFNAATNAYLRNTAGNLRLSCGVGSRVAIDADGSLVGSFTSALTSITTTTLNLTGITTIAGDTTINSAAGSSLTVTSAVRNTGVRTLFTLTGSADTNQTSATEVNRILWTTGSKTWATGNITNQREFLITSPTYNFNGASIITNAYTMFVNAPTAGTNATITNNYAAGFGGNILINTGAGAGRISSAEYSSNLGALYFNQTSRDGSNYAISGIDNANTLINGKTTVNIRINGSDAFNVTSTVITYKDAINIAFNATTGTKIGTGTTQKLSFWNATPIVQPTTAVAAAAFVSNTSLIANDTATFDGYTIGQIVKALRNTGLLA